ncbi:Y-family DNA polymerase [Undibacterium oligocarboniphilum]|uniref:Y-family DNA polymerase n=1 Tax=Undibacterium oligocarboniphilum TaxID=666702 RepID=A0A850QSY2_9BURK|nr:Y-family DNA polymerase [Undibacterium oligocarboniphilum]MBC3871904.1 Y-family DNA polymerase [Undibacterium oligocarboniphilum]NVO79474.1 Y-family DNA polymerase [Undibacterium oligocarboniphilum]
MHAPKRSIGLIDCNNFYASCERVFRPDLNHQPIIVLSNNDGCAVSRSNEAKALGIKMGVPLFKISDLVREHGVHVFSSNYPLYADMSNRVMAILREYSPVQEVYSIDECFLDLTGFHDIDQRARQIRDRVFRETSISVCIGIGASPTLSKLSNFVAKRHPRSQGVFNFNLLNNKQQESVLKNIPVEEIWGIGRQLTKALDVIGIQTALQLRTADISSMRKRFGIVMEKTVRELRGEACIELTESAPAKQQIITSRSFGQPVTEIEELQDALAHFISTSARKLRAQHSCAALLQVFIMTDRFREDQPQYCPSLALPLMTPTASSMTLQRYAVAALAAMFRPGYCYKKAGVILSEIFPETQFQGDMFAGAPDDPSLMATLDQINARFGKGTLKLSQDGSRRSWQMRQDRKSPEYTTNWAELPVCR